MNKINIGVIAEHKIVQAALCSLIASVEDFISVPINSVGKDKLIEELKSKSINVLVISVSSLSISVLNLISHLTMYYPKTKVLLLSSKDSEEDIFKSIRAGSKGYLEKDNDKNELAEAIYSIRNGYDYYSKYITSILLNRYVKKNHSTKRKKETSIDGLSTRQIEILELWANNFSNKDIAEKLFISVRTVEAHKNHIMQRLDLKTTIDMVKFSIKNNIIEI